MNAKERKALQSYVNGEDFDSHSLRHLVNRLLAKEVELQEKFEEEEKKNIKVMAEAEQFKDLHLQQLGKIAELINQKKWLEEQLKVKSISYREQRLINVAKAIIAELEVDTSGSGKY